MSTSKSAVTDAIEALKAKQPAGPHPDDIVAMLDAVPDLRPTLATATDEELAEIFRAFDVSIKYDRDRQMLSLAATITPELTDENDRPEGRSQINEVAGAGLRRKPATVDEPRPTAIVHRIEESRPLGELCPPSERTPGTTPA